jgi:CheY-like chemotaxis protein/predicted regulator of Ras-like GTPase activity (Roadblock/LC7/MglB family)
MSALAKRNEEEGTGMVAHTPSKRVLIVDDDPRTTKILAVKLKKLGEELVIETAPGGDEALTKLEQNIYDLLITDYMMPGMSGLDLIQAARQISPDTQFVLISSYNSNELQHQIRSLNLDGYLDKPINPTEIREIVKLVMSRTSKVEQDKNESSKTVAYDSNVYKQLQSLHVNTGARCVLLISSNGYPVEVVGETSGLNISTICTLVAANFLAAAELANLLGNNGSIFKSSYHEGNNYNVYSYDINEKFLVAVVFGAESKPGIVWFYTKQTALELLPLVENRSAEITFVDDTDEALEASFNTLLSGDEKTDDELGSETNNDIGSKINEKNKEASQPMTFEQAVAAGLVPPQIMDRELDQ